MNKLKQWLYRLVTNRNINKKQTEVRYAGEIICEIYRVKYFSIKRGLMVYLSSINIISGKVIFSIVYSIQKADMNRT